MALDLLCIGEAMAEIRRAPGADFKVGFAGDTYNTAVYAQRALGGASNVGFFTRVGRDPLSAEFQAMAAGEALDVSHIQTDEERLIGIYSVDTDDAGERSFSYWRDQSAARQMFEAQSDIDALPDAKIYYLSGITLAIMSAAARKRLMDHLAALSRAGKALVAFDSNYRPKLWEDRVTAQNTMRDMWAIADIAFPSIDDEMALLGDETEESVVARFTARDWHACAIKRGERGPLSPRLSADELPKFEPAQKVIDTTAAGDSFNGGYFAALIEGKGEAQCLLAGHTLASKIVGVSGAIAPRS